MLATTVYHLLANHHIYYRRCDHKRENLNLDAVETRSGIGKMCACGKRSWCDVKSRVLAGKELTPRPLVGKLRNFAKATDTKPGS